LECWNAGILEKWALGYRNVGLMPTFVFTKNNNGKHPLKSHYSIIPLFHDSMIEAKNSNLKKHTIFH
jgi:hypothetical protein